MIHILKVTPRIREVAHDIQVRIPNLLVSPNAMFSSPVLKSRRSARSYLPFAGHGHYTRGIFRIRISLVTKYDGYGVGLRIETVGSIVAVAHILRVVDPRRVMAHQHRSICHENI